LESSDLAVAMREWVWLYTAIEITHIIGFVVLVGAAVMFDLRLLGLSRQLPVRELGRHLLRASRTSLLMVVPTGILMFTAHAAKLVANPVMRLKLALIAVAGLNALVFRFWSARTQKDWEVSESAPVAAKLSAVVSIVVWLTVIACGRLIAFF
jgi:hypothetical protein